MALININILFAAASIMYEQARRFQLECGSISSIQRRYDCLLSCLNSLQLVDEKYAWIAKPIINEEDYPEDNDDDNMETDDVR